MQKALNLAESILTPLFVVAAAMLAATAVVLVGLIVWYVSTYYDERDYVYEQLDLIPGVEVVEIGGNPDVTLEHIHATVLVNQKDTITFNNLHYESFENPKTVYVSQVRGLSPRTVECAPTTGNSSSTTHADCSTSGLVDLAAGGPFETELGGGIKNVSGAVERIEELANLFESLPQCPLTLVNQASSGGTQHFCVVGVGSTDLPELGFDQTSPDC